MGESFSYECKPFDLHYSSLLTNKSSENREKYAEESFHPLDRFRARISSVCCTRALLPAFCSPSDNWSMQPGQPVTTVWTPADLMAAVFWVLISMDVP